MFLLELSLSLFYYIKFYYYQFIYLNIFVKNIIYTFI